MGRTITVDGVDYTSVWRQYESRWTSRAYLGEVAQSEFVFDDDDNNVDRFDLASRKVVEVWDDASGVNKCLYRGRCMSKGLSRGDVVTGNAMRWVLSSEDYNIDFRGLRVDESTRNEETDYARVLGYAGGYLAGASSTNDNARDSTDLGTTYVINADTVTMEAETYTDVYVVDVLQKICEQSAKTFFAFVDDAGDGQLYYASHTDTTFASTLSLTDVLADHLADPNDVILAEFDTISGEHDGQGLISGGSMRYGAGLFYEYSDPTSEGFHDKWEEHFQDDTITTAFTADRVLKAIINSRNNEQFTYRASFTLPDSDVHRIKAGMTLSYRMAATDVQEAVTQRAVSVTCEPIQPGRTFITVELGVPRGRPFRRSTRGKPGPFPPAGPSTASCVSDVTSLTQISTPNSGFETGLVTNWTPGAIGFHDVIGPGTGDWEGSYYYELNGASSMVYNGITGYSFEAGTTYIFRCRAKDANSTTFMRVTDTAVSANYADVSITSGALWEEFCLEWTPGSTTSGVKVAFASDSGLDNFSVDDLRIYTGGTGDATEPVGETGSGTPGTSTGTYSPIDHVHEHPHLTGSNDYHDADQVSIDDAGGYFTGTDVEAALQELGAGGGGGSITVEEAGGGSVSPVTTIVFDGPTVTDDTGGQVTVTAAAAVHSHGSPDPAGFHGVLVQRTTDFTALNSNDANPEFDTEIYDTDGAWVVGSPKIFTVPASWDGLMVQVGAWVGFESDTSGFAETKIYRNVTPGSISTTNDDKLVPGGVSQHYPAGGYNTFIAHVSAPFQVADGDTLTIAVKTAAGHDALAYEATSILFGMWIVEPGAGGAGATALDDLTDVTITSPASPETLRYNGTAWVNDDRIWRPVMDGSGNVITDGGTGEAIMALS